MVTVQPTRSWRSVLLHGLSIVLLIQLSSGGSLRAQESSGQGQIGFQQYYLRSGSRPIANVSGLTASFDQFLPNVGLLSVSFSPALSNNRFRTGENYLRLKGLPWKGQHWTLNGGDIRSPGALLTTPFSNMFIPEIASSGVAVEGTHEGRTFGFFHGTATVSNSPRVVLRLLVPQKLTGFYVKQKVGSRLLISARFMSFRNDPAAMLVMSNALPRSDLKSATTLRVDSLYTLAGPLQMYAEATWSRSESQTPAHATRNVPISFLAGPVFDTRMLTIRANYTLQSASYFPLLGSYLGDRAGPFGEVAFRPWKRLTVYGTASRYENNVARDPTRPTFRSASESAGATIQLPGRFSVNTQITSLKLSTRANDAETWNTSDSRQQTASLTRPIGRHNLRLAVREFQQSSRISSQRQRSAEIDDTFRIGRLSLGAGVRVQSADGIESRTSLYYRGSTQFSLRRFSLYGNFETGSDLQNRTLLATNTVSTTVAGASMRFGKNWELQAEAFRNNLLSQLNPQSIFVLQGQGVFIPGTLTDLNQWSMYFRMTRSFNWGKAGGMVDPAKYTASVAAPLKGSVEGFVMERLSGGNIPAEGVPVILDQGRTVTTDADGRFQILDVPEGVHKVELALRELPSEFDPGQNTGTTVVVRSNKALRVDLDVVRLATIQGRLTGPKDVPLDSIVIRMLPGTRYTTPDTDGSFSFYNMREGSYEIAVDLRTLPEFGLLNTAERISVAVQLDGKAAEPVAFGFEIRKPVKPVRKVLEKK
jgi:hypothetical protein